MKALVGMILLALGSPTSRAATQEPGGGSTAFCLYALPAEGPNQRFINLAIVQYLDVRTDEVRIYFGGGNLGSGHEARLPVHSREEADDLVTRLRRSAARCAQPTGDTP